MNKELLTEEIYKVLDNTINLRREIHMNPEIGYEEIKTSKLVAETLRSIGVEVTENVGGTGVVGLIRGAKEGKTVLLRDDMDALPVQDETDLEYASKVPGKLHACGHDINVATMLGVAQVLCKYKDTMEGNVKFMFQPAEECAPDGGAKAMIKDGVLQNPKVDYALANHVTTQMEVGKIGIVEGAVTAQADTFEIKVTGKGGHASEPHKGVDAIMASANLIMNLQSVITKMMDPTEQVVISIGKINGGDASNVIASSVFLEGTCRLMTPGYVDKIADLIKQVADNACGVYGATSELKCIKGYSILRNDSKLVEVVKETCRENFGEYNMVIYPQGAGGEDFAFVANEVPAMFTWIGARAKDTDFIPLHNGKVVFDEKCIEIGIKSTISTVSKLINIGI